ncbi:MAG: Thiol:disulfide interchange protein DsbD [Mycoplasmataceae bacterium]|nr:MAG: Thiol:disulfide interchange protein DsbD [Mycoplasmataceae bacterium]
MKSVINSVEEILEFISEKKSSYRFIIIKFSTEWCPPCKKIKEVTKRLEEERKDVFIIEIDAEKSFQLSRDPMFDVFSVPTMFLFDKGSFVRKINGYIDLESLKKFLT